ncbi:unnamed protein product [Spirodela intermedia]|uniref:Uncharacterized protein n=1 Tax=Spirodela intermedia TaxID=51605 RepID=A0A7I8IFE3_SPIIN|nr:unnamed protein product [Spirodela intermedia]CAA6655592.1 unnamed protein product [Spirodela intermedia]
MFLSLISSPVSQIPFFPDICSRSLPWPGSLTIF